MGAQDLVKRARGKQLAPDEYSSGNFFISNMGMFGAEAFDAILPPGRPHPLTSLKSQMMNSWLQCETQAIQLARQFDRIHYLLAVAGVCCTR